MDVLLLRLDAPLLSFGGAIVDNLGVTRRFPSRSMLTGLIANALGWSHGDAARLSNLQSRIRYAVRCDRAGREIVDFQTVGLGQPHLDGTGWTTRGVLEGRAGGDAKTGTHIRERHFLADAAYTVALSLHPAGLDPTVGAVERALHEPARPLFIGRKCCLPALPLVVGLVSAQTLLSALRKDLKSMAPEGTTERRAAWWPDDEDADVASAGLVTVTDERDWHNQIHVGRRSLHQGWIGTVEASK